MLYVYDILLNLTDSSRIYEFFEWELSDNIEHIKKIPIFKIGSKILDEIIKSNIKIEREFLNKVYNLTEIYNNKKIEKIKYACVFADSFKAIVIEFNEQGESILKSRMLLDEEEDSINIATRLQDTSIKYKIIKRNSYNPYLTREEEKIKYFLENEITMSYKLKDFNKLKYIYVEYFNEIKDNIKEMYIDLIESLEKGITDEHINLFSLINLSYSKKSKI